MNTLAQSAPLTVDPCKAINSVFVFEVGNRRFESGSEWVFFFERGTFQRLATKVVGPCSVHIVACKP